MFSVCVNDTDRLNVRLSRIELHHVNEAMNFYENDVWRKIATALLLKNVIICDFVHLFISSIPLAISLSPYLFTANFRREENRKDYYCI